MLEGTAHDLVAVNMAFLQVYIGTARNMNPAAL